ncbi:MAG: hypothetical protein M3Y42_13605 [Actinomycetota bacterium]|nr:hypothetical protein [Actinomycetota bacterium]MDQ2957990.1 hypothetical protein [Actinomycetota bacterium]
MVKLNFARHRRLVAGIGAVSLAVILVSSTAADASTWNWHPQKRIPFPAPSFHPSRPPVKPSRTPTPTKSVTPSKSVTPTPTKTSTPTPTPTKSSTPAPSPTPTPTANCANPKNPWASLEACGWAGPANTGYRSANCPNGLTVNSGGTTRVIAVTKANTVLSCQRITGSLDIQAQNVTISDSYVSYDGGGVGGSGVIKIEDGASATVDHVEINGLNHTHSCVWLQGTAATVRNVNCYGINDGIFSWADTKYSSTTGDNFSISDSYFHDFTANAANGHIDGYQTEGASNGVIKHNTYLMTSDADSAIAIWDSLKSSSNIAVSNNLITGGGFSVYAEDYSPSESNPVGGFTITNISFTGNTFSTHAAKCVGGYGTWFARPSWKYQGGPTDGWHRSGNVVLETGEKIDANNPHVNGTLCT